MKHLNKRNQVSDVYPLMYFNAYIEIPVKIMVMSTQPKSQLGQPLCISCMANMHIFEKETLFCMTLLSATCWLTALSEQSKWSITNTAAHKYNA